MESFTNIDTSPYLKEIADLELGLHDVKKRSTSVIGNGQQLQSSVVPQSRSVEISYKSTLSDMKGAETNKDKLISNICYSPGGYGSVKNTYDDVVKKDSSITVAYVKDWFKRNIERTTQLKG